MKRAHAAMRGSPAGDSRLAIARSMSAIRSRDWVGTMAPAGRRARPCHVCLDARGGAGLHRSGVRVAQDSNRRATGRGGIGAALQVKARSGWRAGRALPRLRSPPIAPRFHGDRGNWRDRILREKVQREIGIVLFDDCDTGGVVFSDPLA